MMLDGYRGLNPAVLPSGFCHGKKGEKLDENRRNRTHRIHVWYIYLHLPWSIYLSTYHDLVFGDVFSEEARCCLWLSQVLLGEKYMSSSHFSWWWHDWAGSDFHYAAADDYTRTFEHSQSNQPTFFLRVEKLATNFLRLPEVVLKISDMAQIPGKKQGNEHDSQSGTPNWFSKTSCLAENDELKSFINYPVRLVRDRLIQIDGSEILHQLISTVSNDSQGFIHPKWCRVFSIHSIFFSTRPCQAKASAFKFPFHSRTSPGIFSQSLRKQRRETKHDDDDDDGDFHVLCYLGWPPSPRRRS